MDLIHQITNLYAHKLLDFQLQIAYNNKMSHNVGPWYMTNRVTHYRGKKWAWIMENYHSDKYVVMQASPLCCVRIWIDCGFLSMSNTVLFMKYDENPVSRMTIDFWTELWCFYCLLPSSCLTSKIKTSCYKKPKEMLHGSSKLVWEIIWSWRMDKYISFIEIYMWIKG